MDGGRTEIETVRPAARADRPLASNWQPSPHMFQSLNIAAAGMAAQETQLDTIANNLANANTVGYKLQNAELEDLLYQKRPFRPGSPTAAT